MVPRCAAPCGPTALPPLLTHRCSLPPTAGRGVPERRHRAAPQGHQGVHPGARHHHHVMQPCCAAQCCVGQTPPPGRQVLRRARLGCCGARQGHGRRRYARQAGAAAATQGRSVDAPSAPAGGRGRAISWGSGSAPVRLSPPLTFCSSHCFSHSHTGALHFLPPLMHLSSTCDLLGGMRRLGM